MMFNAQGQSRGKSIGRSLRILAVVVLVAVAVVTGQQLWRARVTRLEGTAYNLSRLAMVFAEQTGRATETVDLILRDLVEAPPPRGPADAISLGQVLARRIAGVRQITAIEVANAAGRILFESGPGLDATLPDEAKAALARHAAEPKTGLLISMPRRDRDGRWTALMTRRVNAADGGFGGIAIAFLNLAYFEDFYRAVELNENGAIILHRRDGVVLARFPRADAVVGTSYAGQPPFSRVLAHANAGTVVMASPLDGGDRVLAIQALKAFPLAVSVSVDQDRVLAPWWREVRVLGTAGLVAGLGLSGLLALLARRIRDGALAERLRSAEALARVAAKDPLTGLLNRATLTERLGRMLRDADRAGTQIALLFLDIDRFAQINDAYGHATGDALLRAVSDRLAAEAGGAEVARWGGDEFVIAVPVVNSGSDVDGRCAVATASRLMDCVALPIDIAGQSVRVGSTVGIAYYPRDGRTQDALIGAADFAMYAGKQAGGAMVRAFDPALARAAADSHQLESELRRALADDMLTLSYQPIIQMPGERCVAMEALVRWSHPTRGMVDPAEFIQVAEHSGLIGRLGQWALERACLDAMTWPGDAAPGVTVNVSMAQIGSGLLPADVRAALAKSGLAAGRLQLEITESLVGAEHARIVPVLRHLRELGVQIALDDFGTGFSSLSRLRNWPIDTIKIDRSFTRAMGSGGTAIIRATLLVANEYGLDVTAEGVETREQHTQLVALGVRRLQGYLYSRPLDAGAAARWISLRAA